MFKLLLFSGVVCFVSSAQAQADPRIAPGVQISPARFDWNLQAGEERSGVVNLKNYSDKTYDVDIQLENFYVTEDSNQSIFYTTETDPSRKAYDVINWIERPDGLTLAPGEGKDVFFKVKVPEKTPTAGYYGALFFNTTIHRETTEPKTSMITVHQKIGVLLVLGVEGLGPIQRSGEMVKFSASHPVFFSGPVMLVSEIKNTGNIHYRGEGKINIYRFGKLIDSLGLDSKVFYPDKFRHYESEWWFSPWGYGPYTAQLTFASDDGSVRLMQETRFWVIPWKTTIMLAMLLALWLSYEWLKRLLNQRRKKSPSNT